MIKDSGERREFSTGAVRDIQEGKGRCDLMPLDVIAECYKTHFSRTPTHEVLNSVYLFCDSGDYKHLIEALSSFLNESNFGGWSDMFISVSKQFEEGAQKYGENNWQKGLPVNCYIDSAVRHFMKFLRGDADEFHDRAFVWNILCCIWTCKHKPELNNYATQS